MILQGRDYDWSNSVINVEYTLRPADEVIAGHVVNLIT
jgi:hypothetical protein